MSTVEQVTKYLLQAQDQTGAAVASAKGGLDGLQSAAGRLNAVLGLVGVGFSLDAIVGGIKETVDAMDSLGEESQKVGLSVEAWTALQYAAKMSGVEVDTLAGAVSKLNKGMFEAVQNPDGNLATLFNALGIAVTDADGRLRAADQVIADLAESFARLPDGPEKSALAMEVFGKSGADMVPLLNQGAEGIARLRDEAEKLGVVLSDDAAKAAGEFNDALDKMAERWRGVKLAAAEWLLPAMNTWTTEVEKAADKTNESAGAWEAFKNTWAALRDQVRLGIGLEPVTKQIKEHQDVAAEVQEKKSMPTYLRDLANASKEAAAADKARVEAARELVATTQAQADVQRSENSLAAAYLGLSLEQAKSDYAIAKAKGDEVAARDAKVRIASIEIQQARLQAEASAIEAQSSLSLAQAKLEEAKARGQNVEAAQLEVEAAQKRLQAAQLGVEKVGEMATRSEELARITDKVSTSTTGAAVSMMGYAEASADATAQVAALAEMEQRLADIRDAANKARTQGGSASWEYMLGSRGIELSAEQLRTFKAEIESIYEYLRGTFDGKVVSSTYLMDEAIQRAVDLVTTQGSRASGPTGGNTNRPTATAREDAPTSRNNGITIVVQGSMMSTADDLARAIKPALDRVNRLRS